MLACTESDSAQVNTARSWIFREYLHENKLLSKTILACLSGVQLGSINEKKYIYDQTFNDQTFNDRSFNDQTFNAVLRIRMDPELLPVSGSGIKVPDPDPAKSKRAYKIVKILLFDWI